MELETLSRHVRFTRLMQTGATKFGGNGFQGDVCSSDTKVYEIKTTEPITIRIIWWRIKVNSKTVCRSIYGKNYP